MASNTSQRKMRNRTMAARLSDYPTLVLTIDCGEPRCLGLRTYAVASMVGGGNRMTVGETLGRMRCQKCGKPPAEAVLQSFPGAKPEQRLVLIGPGAYS